MTANSRKSSILKTGFIRLKLPKKTLQSNTTKKKKKWTSQSQKKTSRLLIAPLTNANARQLVLASCPRRKERLKIVRNTCVGPPGKSTDLSCARISPVKDFMALKVHSISTSRSSTMVVTKQIEKNWPDNCWQPIVTVPFTKS
jgi:hypothetical protein